MVSIDSFHLGFMQLVIPLLKSRHDISLNVFTKEKVEVLYDLRLKVTSFMEEAKQQQ